MVWQPATPPKNNLLHHPYLLKPRRQNKLQDQRQVCQAKHHTSIKCRFSSISLRLEPRFSIWELLMACAGSSPVLARSLCCSKWHLMAKRSSPVFSPSCPCQHYYRSPVVR